MQVEDVPEINLWRAVIIHATRDAQSNTSREGCGAKRVYKWSRSADCKEVCYYAQLDHDTIRLGFIDLYLSHLDKQLISYQKELAKSDESKEVVENEINSIKEEILEVLARMEKIKCQKL